MSTPSRTRHVFAPLAAFLCSLTPSLHGQTPSPAAKFNDSISIFRETSTSEWPALFLSPVPFDAQAQTLEGLTLTVGKESGNIGAIFATSSEIGSFSFQTAGGLNFSVYNSGFGFDNGLHGLVFEANDGFLLIDGANVLTETSLQSALHFAKISMGAGSSAAGANAFSAGNNASASGLNSAAFGLGTKAQGYNQFVVGQYNTPLGTGGVNVNANDPLFIVGNGSSAVAPSNAFVVKRNGDTTISGKLTAGVGASATGDGTLALGDHASTGVGVYATAIGFFASADGYGASAFGNGSTAGSEAVAIGSNAFALADFSIAVGSGAQANDVAATAIGIGAIAAVDSSFAAGNGSIANAAGAVALGGGIANGDFSSAFPYSETIGHASTAMGYASRTDGLSSMALGRGIIAQGLNQVVVGQFNVASGTPHNSWSEMHAWDPGDEILIVGNGQNDGSRSNAFTVKKNAATGIGTGVVTTTPSQTVVGRYNDTAPERANGLFVVGMGTGTDPAQRKNAIRVREDGTLLVRPAGDLSMGGFEAGDQP
jgi:hypothetical protein